MLVRDVAHIIEQWAPRAVAWDRDNVGLQVGDPGKRVGRVLVALDAAEAVVAEGKKEKADLIVTHHPLLFRPPRSITTNDRVGKIVTELIQSNIALYSVHTNLDFTIGGVSFVLGEKLGLQELEFLKNNDSDLRKVAVFVPAADVGKLTEAMAGAGAGLIGKYDHCSFRIEGKGTFRGGERTKPHVGQAGRLEEVDEVRLEMIVPRWKVAEVLRAMKNAHPYEEVGYDVYVLENESTGFGAGVIGNLPEGLELQAFLKRIKDALHVPTLRYAGARRTVRRVAMCGGSGADLLDEAIARNADAFVTADVRYHQFEAAADRIVLIDAGHFETEHPSLDRLVAHIEQYVAQKQEDVRVMKTSVNTNPVQYY